MMSNDQASASASRPSFYSITTHKVPIKFLKVKMKLK
jgi:hypothetical protein